MSFFAESLRAFLKPVVPFLDDPEVSEVLINGPREVWIEKKGKLHKTEAVFSEEGLLAAARNMAQYVGRPLTDERPRLDARLPDGSRIHVVLPPVARRGTTISIRKFLAERLTPATLLEYGSLTPLMSRFLQACVQLEQNLVIAGGTGSGKTSLLNVLSSFIGEDERILTIEDSAELQLQQRHLVSFESRPPDKFGKGAVDIGDLLHSALRLRPDRIIVGEVRGGEAFHLLQAMNTGHGGSLTTAHANSPIDTLRRLESLCLLSGIELPLRAVRAQVASAVHLVVCCARLADGTRKITYVSEVLPLDSNGEYRVQDLFLWVQTGRTADGGILGHHAPTGLLPTFFSRFAAEGHGDLTAGLFHPAAHGLPTPPAFQKGLGESSKLSPAPPAEALDVSGAFALAGTTSGHPAAHVAFRAPLAADAGVALPPLDPEATREAAERDPGASGSAGLQLAPTGLGSLEAPAAEAAGSAVETTANDAPPEDTPPARKPVSVARAAAPGPAAPLKASPPRPLRSPDPRPAPARPAPTEAEAPEERQQAVPMKRAAPTAPDAASVQLDPEMAAEVERALPHESTLITRNPLLDRAPPRPLDEDTHPRAKAPKR